MSQGEDSPTPVHHCEATWVSLNQRGYPQWFSDAKQGIFIHWGLYSVPALAGREGYGEWFYRGLMAGDTNRAKVIERLSGKRGSTPLEQYATLTRLWKGEYWQPDSWAKLFQQAGAQYVILVTKHHDGYCLWDWDRPLLPDWTSVKSGLGRSFGINHNEPLSNYLTSEELISHFAKLVAGGGGLTLNVGPEADGRISLIQQERLLDLGRWLKRNGEAIYRSRPCAIPLEYGESRYDRIDSIIDFNWVRNAHVQGMTYDHFHIEWDGTVTPCFDETYTFTLDADDRPPSSSTTTLSSPPLRKRPRKTSR